jgi:transcriptional regulator with XRE-family HTH domain
MKLKNYMNLKGITNKEMEKLLKLDRGYFSQVKNGRKPSNPIYQILIKVTNGLVTPNDFYDELKEKEQYVYNK